MTTRLVALVDTETVHLHQQLVQRLLALVVAAAHAGAAPPRHGIDLIDEDDARRVPFRFRKHIAHAGSADTHEHLHEIRTGDAEERHVGLARDGLGQQRLTRAGRTL